MTSLAFDVLWRDRGAQKGMRELGAETEKTGTRFAKFKTLAAGAGLVAGAALLKFGKDSVAAFKESEQAQTRLSDAFVRFPKLSNTSAAALRGYNSELSKKTKFDDDATASGQAVLAQFDLTGKQITELTPLLQDYAAKTGKDLPAAARDLGKAVMGQGRALKVVGLDLKDTGTATGNLDQLMGGLRSQVGGFAEKEGKTAAGQTAILANQFGELQEAAGAKLLPAINGVVGGLIKAVDIIDKNKVVIGPLVGVVGGLAAAMWLSQKASAAWGVATALNTGFATRAVAGLAALKLGYTGVGLSAVAAGRAMKIAQLAIPVVGVALFAVTTAMQLFAARSEEGSVEANTFSDAMQSVEGNVTRATAALNEQVRAQAVNALQSKGALDQAKMLGLSYATVTDAALGNKDAIAEVNRVTSAAAALNPALSKSNSELRNAAIGLSGSLHGVAVESISATDAERQRRDAMQTSAPATDTLVGAQKRLRDVTGQVRGELQKVVDKLTILKEGALSQERANLAWGDALQSVARSAKDNGKSLDANTEKGRNNRRSIVDAMSALNDKTVADFKNAAQSKNSAEATRRASERYRENRKDLRDAAIAAGFSKEEVRKMIGQYSKTPKQLKTEVSTPGSRAAKEEMQKLKDRIEDLKSRSVAIKVKYGASGSVAVGSIKDRKLAGLSAATGGVLPGFTPGRDVHRFTSPTAGTLDLSGGEAVMRPEWTRAVGGPPAVARMNAAARRGQAFADGGVVNLPNSRAWLTAGRAERDTARRLYERQWGFQTGNTQELMISYRNRFRDRDKAERFARTEGTVLRAGRFWYAFADLQRATLHAQRKLHGRIPTQALASGGVVRLITVRSDTNSAPNILGAHNAVTGRVNRYAGQIAVARAEEIGKALAAYQRKKIKDAKADAAGSGSGPSIAAGPGWGPIMAAMRRHGARNFNTYPGHHPSMAMARDVTPHNWAMANAAKALSSVWYVIYRMKIASKTRNNAWQPYSPITRMGDWRHEHHVHVARRRDKGGMLRPGQLAINQGAGDERVLSPAQTRSFDQLVRVMDRGGSHAGASVSIHVSFPNYVGDKADLKRALVDMNRLGQLDVIKRVA